MSSFAVKMCQALGIKQNTSTAFHPGTDGQSERTNQKLEQFLRFYSNAKQDNWAHFLSLAEFAFNLWRNESMKKSPFEVLMGYNPRAEWTTVSSPVPQVTHRLEQIQEARNQASTAMRKAQLGWIKDKEKKQHAFQKGDQVWLNGRNIKMYHPTAKLAPKCHGPFPVQRVLSAINYQLMIPEQWKIHDVFHVDLLTPYREMEFHGPNYAQPPPDLVGEEEQYKVEQVLDERNHGRWKRKQYLVKWKGYPDSDNQWLDAKDMENAQELIAEFHNSNSKLRSHIRRALEHLHVLHPLSSTLPSTSTSTHMSDVAHSSDHTTAVEENMNPLPVPPRMVTPDAPTSSARAAVSTPTTFYRVRDEDFPHPDEPTSSELNDSDQENVPPPVIPSTTHTSPPVQAEALGRTRVSIPFTNEDSVNRALVSALTRVQNNIDRGNMYQLKIEEIVRIGRALQYRGTPSDDEEAALLVAQLDNIRRLESGMETDSAPSPPPANVTFPTPTVPRHSQVTASTAASCARVRAVARGSAPPQPTRTHGSRGSGSQAHHLGTRVPPIPEGVRVGAELLLARPSRGAEMPPPLGFNFNRGANYVPCIVTDNRGRGIPACYTRVIMGPDPHIIGIIPGDSSQYGGPLHARV